MQAQIEKVIKSTVLTLKVESPEMEIEKIKAGLQQNGGELIGKSSSYVSSNK